MRPPAHHLCLGAAVKTEIDFKTAAGAELSMEERLFAPAAAFLLWAMRRQDILRMLLFVVFFSVGAAALSGSILCDDLLRYYNSRQLLKSTEESLGQLKSLNADYDALLEQLQKDPSLVKRIAPATLGTEPADAGAIYPKATAEQLAAARKALTEELNQQPAESIMPDWIVRCSEPHRRIILLLAGAFLILISFIWFGPAKQAGQKES